MIDFAAPCCTYRDYVHCHADWRRVVMSSLYVSRIIDTTRPMSKRVDSRLPSQQNAAGTRVARIQRETEPRALVF